MKQTIQTFVKKFSKTQWRDGAIAVLLVILSSLISIFASGAWNNAFQPLFLNLSLCAFFIMAYYLLVRPYSNSVTQFLKWIWVSAGIVISFELLLFALNAAVSGLRIRSLWLVNTLDFLVLLPILPGFLITNIGSPTWFLQLFTTPSGIVVAFWTLSILSVISGAAAYAMLRFAFLKMRDIVHARFAAKKK